MKKAVAKACLAASLMAAASMSLAGDIAAGKARSATCVACHGAAGISNSPTFPNLAGQKAMYLESALKAYKNGDRKGNNMANIMKEQAAGLTDQDIKNLAAYYASLK